MNQEKLIVLGSGESGIGAAILAKKQGFDVFLSDCNEINKDLSFFLLNLLYVVYPWLFTRSKFVY